MARSLLFLNPDSRILDLIRKGDEGALVDLYRSSRRPVSAFVTRNSGSSDDAEDVLQEALIVLWERVRSGRFEYTAQLGTFVFATARNLWLRRLARMRRERPGIPDGIDVPDDRDSALDIMMESERSRLLERALHQLGEPCRELLMLFYWEELSLNDIAQRMGFANADTVKSKKYQCKKALRRLVDTID
jgi:RNA polymerase sigma factor (sigma-70 family)